LDPFNSTAIFAGIPQPPDRGDAFALRAQSHLIGAFGVIVHISVPRSMISAMQLTTGVVVGGKVVVDGDPLPDGTVVTILARDADETFEVPPELEAELLESLAEAARGETISADELIERLRRIS
jgi:hypothetical protein